MAAQQTQYAGRLIRDFLPYRPYRNFLVPLQCERLLRALTTCLVCVLIGLSLSLTLCLLLTSKAYANPLLLDQYQQLKPELSDSIFGKPILLNSETGENYVRGEAYAVLDAPIDAMDELLSKTVSWCELGILHVNVKSCVYDNEQVLFYVGCKHYQEPSDAHPVLYRFKQLAEPGQHLNVKLTALGGPFGTYDYQMRLKAVPINEQQSFIHYQYSYRFGLLAELALKTYLATLGRHKVGFTITGIDPRGEPVYIKGQQGVIERNIMRYIFAIQSLMEARNLSEKDRQQQRIKNWFDHIAEFPRQLVELKRSKYYENKRREIENQTLLQENGINGEDLFGDEEEED